MSRTRIDRRGEEQQGFCVVCGARFHYAEGHPQIYVEGSKAEEVERVSRSLFASAPASRPQKKFPLVSAVFFLTLFIVVFGAILTAAHMLAVYVLPLVVIGGVTTFSVVGAFILRQEQSLWQRISWS